jgi:hypothetical protein
MTILSQIKTKSIEIPRKLKKKLERMRKKEILSLKDLFKDKITPC